MKIVRVIAAIFILPVYVVAFLTGSIVSGCMGGYEDAIDFWE